MISVRSSSIGAIVFAMIVASTPNAMAENRYFNTGQTIDAAYWLEDAQIDPVMFFVYPHEPLTRWNMCTTDFDRASATAFLELFTKLQLDGVFDEVDASLVWTKRECLGGPATAEIMGRNLKTYERRRDKIREVMRREYEMQR